MRSKCIAVLPLCSNEMTRKPLRIPRRYSHFAFGVIQSGLTCAIAAAIACAPFLSQGTFLMHWLRAFGAAWLIMLPVVVLAAPAILRMVEHITAE